MEIGSSFDPPAAPFIPKKLALKSNISQGFTLHITDANKNLIYEFKIYTFCNGSPKDVLEANQKMQKVVKCKPADITEGQFDLVEVLLKGDAFIHCQEFKCIKTMCMNKNPNNTDMALLGMCLTIFRFCPQEPKKHYFPNNLAQLQKVYLHKHTGSQNTDAQL
eukprot:15366432-Ditylum_brightwellii.AAC.2